MPIKPRENERPKKIGSRLGRLRERLRSSAPVRRIVDWVQRVRHREQEKETAEEPTIRGGAGERPVEQE